MEPFTCRRRNCPHWKNSPAGIMIWRSTRRASKPSLICSKGCSSYRKKCGFFATDCTATKTEIIRTGIIWHKSCSFPCKLITHVYLEDDRFTDSEMDDLSAKLVLLGLRGKVNIKEELVSYRSYTADIADE